MSYLPPRQRNCRSQPLIILRKIFLRKISVQFQFLNLEPWSLIHPLVEWFTKILDVPGTWTCTLYPDTPTNLRKFSLTNDFLKLLLRTISTKQRRIPGRSRMIHMDSTLVPTSLHRQAVDIRNKTSTGNPAEFQFHTVIYSNPPSEYLTFQLRHVDCSSMT